MAENKEKILALRVTPLTMAMINREHLRRKTRTPWKRATITAIVVEAIHAYLDPKVNIQRDPVEET